MAERRLHRNKKWFLIFFAPVWLSFIVSCATGPSELKSNIAIDNQINECIEIVPKALVHKQGYAYLETIWNSKKSTGYCGCKSAMLTYKVVAMKGGAFSTLFNNEFTSLRQEGYDFMVCHDSQQEDYEAFTIKIQCQNPE